MKLTKEQLKVLNRRLAFAISAAEECGDAKQTLVKIYSEYLKDKSPQQCEMMADEVVNSMSEFQAHYESAQISQASYILTQLNEVLITLDLERQCLMLAMAAEIYGYKGLNDEDFDNDAFAKTVAEKAEERCRGKVSEELRKELLIEVARLVHAADYTSPELRRKVEEMDIDEFRSYYEFAEWMDRDSFTAITSMVLYTMVCTGDIDCPPEVTVKQVVANVCRSDYAESIYSYYAADHHISYDACMHKLEGVEVAANVLTFGAAAAAAIGIGIATSSLGPQVAAALSLVSALLLTSAVKSARDSVHKMLSNTATKLTNLSVELNPMDIEIADFSEVDLGLEDPKKAANELNKSDVVGRIKDLAKN